VSEDIRVVVIEAIGDWVAALPAEFLADAYLKYLAWALSDRAPGVRRAALAALAKLYGDEGGCVRVRSCVCVCEVVWWADPWLVVGRALVHTRIPPIPLITPSP
jgi:hypothetical protein